MIITGGIAGGSEGNGSEGSGFWGVGGVIGFKYLDVGAKFKTQFGVVRGRHARDKGGWTHGRGDTVWPRKKVETGDRVGN